MADSMLATSSGMAIVKGLRRASAVDALVRAAAMDDPDKAEDRSAADRTRARVVREPAPPKTRDPI